MPICTVCGSLLTGDAEHVHTTPIMLAILDYFKDRLIPTSAYQGVLDILCRYQNWEGISALRDQMIKGSIINQDDADAITKIFEDNGIILP